MPLQCDICKKSMPHKQGLALHRQRHSDDQALSDTDPVKQITFTPPAEHQLSVIRVIARRPIILLLPVLAGALAWSQLPEPFNYAAAVLGPVFIWLLLLNMAFVSLTYPVLALTRLNIEGESHFIWRTYYCDRKEVWDLSGPYPKHKLPVECYDEYSGRVVIDAGREDGQASVFDPYLSVSAVTDSAVAHSIEHGDSLAVRVRSGLADRTTQMRIGGLLILTMGFLIVDYLLFTGIADHVASTQSGIADPEVLRPIK